MTGEIDITIGEKEYKVSYTIRNCFSYPIIEFDLGNMPDQVLDIVETPYPDIHFYPNGRCVYWDKWIKAKDRKKISAIIKNYIVKELL